MQQLMSTEIHNANWIQHHFAQVSEELKSDQPDTDEIVYNLAEVLSTDGHADFEYEMKNALKKMAEKLGFNAAFRLATRAGLFQDRSLMREVTQTWYQVNKPN